ncbi:3-oxoacyl-ACP reductase FabG [Blochmannia endosymbiont of Polyrhachis (Hedomyrma) turneri]|uniref:3-oxoacyl-ACP reductase FabG n=1 Tax=Blochmannia endosymbiont of Polyrhachis (Hedomyrma) turneri TaxID=1505596 RepID=UPI00061A653E|nr:3-oxoacyl-ACP reductase FabG [Blochmannia endosymbiont of Polyrhachis (Hedomyrma) turneri]AKC59968.1 3-oxoacyl-[acyl-carrier-protein] reductase FabG [Blochmannia endosymbiont of Polyrhachis (Hedomyrma) turneri]
MSFEKRIALVTGATRGIGRAISEMLVMSGAIVIGTSTNAVGVKIINSYLKDAGLGMELDVTDLDSIVHVLKNIKLKFGDIDILINNAGIVQDSLLVHMKDNQWESIINTNLTSVYRMSKSVVRSMLKNRYGRIINISSVVGFMGNIGQSNYSAAKSGMIGFSKSLAREVAARGVTVNVVAPGFISTDMIENLSDKYRVSILSKIPMNCFGDPKDVAHAVVFLASDSARYITGETVHVNGGMYML